MLLDTLKQCDSSVVSISLASNLLDNDCMPTLGEFLFNNPNMLSVNVNSNSIGDNGIEILSSYLLGNTTLSGLNFYGNRNITNNSLPFLIDIAEKSCVKHLLISRTLISEENKLHIYKLLDVPIDKRELPIISKTKSAAKTSTFKR